MAPPPATVCAQGSNSATKQRYVTTYAKHPQPNGRKIDPFFLFLITSTALYIEGIKVPVETTDENVTNSGQVVEEVIPIYYVSNQANRDPYLIPPDPHKPEEVEYHVATPATYLLPPAPDAKNEYFFKTTEPGEQSDWYPIAPEKLTEVIPLSQAEDPQKHQKVKENLRTGKLRQISHGVTVPSRNLLPPREDAPNDFVLLSPSVELELPLEEIDHTLNNSPTTIQVPVSRDRLKYPLQFPFKLNPIPVSYITPPKIKSPEYKNPTRLYPKKYKNEFVPIPIPISQFAGDSMKEMPIVHPLKPVVNIDEYSVPDDQKKKYLHEQHDQKRKLKQQNEEPEPAIYDGPSKTQPAEQEVSETNYRNHGHNEYPSALKPTYNDKHGIKSKGERTEFRMHGMKGPHSYQFGYDTGKGKNRQFRYEERDNDGHVRGHYGYVDKFGKLRVVNYDADPEHGFRAEVPVEKEQ
ncbi:unnamed protein product [Euphydryas editha]|uniref:Cuticle protein n=1 Tax=Euphydryas editha TaxID=104508 RepID=A0AAU9V6P6_EUPED|nr:unnamed protein product [Euphydryas editha]